MGKLSRGTCPGIHHGNNDRLGSSSVTTHMSNLVTGHEVINNIRRKKVEPNDI